MKTTMIAFIQLSLGLSLLAQSSFDPSQTRSTIPVSPSYFFANGLAQGSGKRIVENDNVLAVLQTPQGRMFLTRDGLEFSNQLPPESQKGQGNSSVFRLGIPHEQAQKRTIEPRFEDPLEGKANFFIGAKENWQCDVSLYQKVHFPDVWEGVSLEYEAHRDHLVLRILVAPHGKLDQVELMATLPEMGGKGGVEERELEQRLRPRAFQSFQGQQLAVAASFHSRSKGHLGLTTASFRDDAPITIETEVEWATFLGGRGNTHLIYANDMVIDPLGCAYVAGTTDYDSNLVTNAFIAKLSPDGSQLLYIVYLGGRSGDSEGYDVAIDSAGNAYLSGKPCDDFTTTVGAYDRSPGDKAFVCKLNPTGDTLLYATFLGGSDLTVAGDLAVDASGRAMITGKTNSADFPVTSGALDETYSGGTFDAFVTALNSDGSGLVFSTFIGGSAEDKAEGLTLDPDGNAFVVGTTSSDDFPTSPASITQKMPLFGCFALKLDASGSALDYVTKFAGKKCNAVAYCGQGEVFVAGEAGPGFDVTGDALQPTLGGVTDCFLAKLGQDGSWRYGTYLGGSAIETLSAMVLGPDGSIFLGGATESNNFPTTAGAMDRSNSSTDGFMSRIDPTGATLIYSTFLGGSRNDRILGLAVDSLGNAHCCGMTNSENFPSTPGAFDEIYNFTEEAFACKLNPEGTALVYGTFFGGSGYVRAGGVAVDTQGDTYVSGYTVSNEFPTTLGSFQTSIHAKLDTFITKFNAAGSDLVYSTFIGGKGSDYNSAVVVDNQGSAYLTGITNSSDFPITKGAADSTIQGTEVYALKLNPDGNQLVYSTFVGGNNSETALDLEVDRQGQAHILGTTQSTDFPITKGAYDTSFEGSSELFVAKLSASGTGFEYATFFGDQALVTGYALALDQQGQACIVGSAGMNLPTSPGVFQPMYSGLTDGFLAKFQGDGSALVFATYLGGSAGDIAKDLVIDQDDNLYIVGKTYSADFPTANAYDPSQNGYSDIFVTKLDAGATQLYYSTYLGGTGNDDGSKLALDPDRSLFVLGEGGNNFPTTTGERFGQTVFAKLSPDGAVLNYATLLRGAFNALASDEHYSAYLVGIAHRTFLATPGAYDEIYNISSKVGVMKIDFFCAPLRLRTVTLVAQGLNPIELNAELICSGFDGEVAWTDLSSGTSFGVGINPILLDPIPLVTSDYQVRINDSRQGELTRTVRVLVSENPDYQDLDGDGCNTIADLQLLIESWLSEAPGDPNGDGIVNVIDLLYINTQDPYPCTR